MFQCVNALKHITKKSIQIKIPFYAVSVHDWKVESWHTTGGELVILMEKKECVKENIDIVKPISIQESFEYARYPGERG